MTATQHKLALRLCTTSIGEPAGDMALSHALLRAVATGHAPPLVRLYLPQPTTAFGKRDALEDGFIDACAAARRHGTTPTLRLGGGRAAVYHEGCVVVEVIERAALRSGTEERFRAWTTRLSAALQALGVACKIGERPGEYCPGRWSIHLPGGPKVVGAAQRSIQGSSMFTAVMVVEYGARTRAALVDVYDALGIAWDTSTAGAITDQVPDVTAEAVATAVLAAVAPTSAYTPDGFLLSRAAALSNSHAL